MGPEAQRQPPGSLPGGRTARAGLPREAHRSPAARVSAGRSHGHTATPIAPLTCAACGRRSGPGRPAERGTQARARRLVSQDGPRAACWAHVVCTPAVHTQGPPGTPAWTPQAAWRTCSLSGGSGAGSQPAGRGRVCRFQSGCKYSRPVFRLLAGRYAPPCAPGTGQTLGGTQLGLGGLHTPGHGGGRGFWPRSQVRLLRRLWGFNFRAGRGSAPGNVDHWTGPLQGWPGSSAVLVGRLGAVL